jgi:hypothetical protein
MKTPERRGDSPKMTLDNIHKFLAALASALIVIGIGVALFRGGIPTEFRIGGVWGSKPEGPQPSTGAPGAPRPGTELTVWQSECDEGQAAISGTCIILSGPSVPLQNIGPNHFAANRWRWKCAWAGPVHQADV